MGQEDKDGKKKKKRQEREGGRECKKNTEGTTLEKTI